MAGEIVKPKVHNCPSCGAALTISAAGYTTTVVCGSCNSILDANHSLMQIIGKFNTKNKYSSSFELGSYGVLKGIKWKMIGFVVRQDRQYNFTWEEYLLYNPYNGFRWLLKIDGHYSITNRLPAVPISEDKNIKALEFTYDKRSYRLFNSGKATVLYVVGEFYWRVKQGETVSMRDFISPPYMISEEVVDKAEVNYSISEYLTTEEVFSAFKLVNPNNFNYPSGVAANQPNPNAFSRWNLLIMVGAVVLLFVTSFILGLTKLEKNVFTGDFPTENPAVSVSTPTSVAQTPFGGMQPALPVSKETMSTTFEVPDGKGNLEIEMSSPVSNQWAEAQVTLVNETNGEEHAIEQGVEYYYGSDSDGAWSEGSQSSSKIISLVPGGKYHIEVEMSGSQPNPMANIKLNRHSSMGANFLIALLFLVFPPVFTYMRYRSFEVSRWSNSDYSPYPQLSNSTDYGDDDDE